MLPRWFSPLMVAVIAGFSVWFFSKQPEDTTAPSTDRATMVADTFMENFTTRVMDAQGQIQYQLVAAYMAHYPHDDHSQLETPLLTMFRPDGDRWTVQSETGLLENGTAKITLQGEVLMQQHTTAADTENLEIQTRDMLLLPEESYAETDQYALITRGNIQMESIGLQADLISNRIYLLSQVRGIYEAQP